MTVLFPLRCSDLNTGALPAEEVAQKGIEAIQKFV